jgi:cobalamin biosynthesis protein CobT
MIHIPSSLNHPNILDEEIEAYYAIKCVRDADYDFEKQFDKMITEYVDSIKFPSKGARRSFKSQLKKMVLVDKPKNSKKYSAFQQWRLRQIEFHKNKQRDMLMKKKNNNTESTIDVDKLLITINEKDKIIEQLMKENEELKAQLAAQKPQEEFIEDEKNFITSDDDEVEEVVFTDDEPEPETEEESEEESEEEPETEEESEEEESEEEEQAEQSEKPEKKEKITDPAHRRHIISIYHQRCIEHIQKYLDKYIQLKEGKNKIEIEKLQKDIRDQYKEEIVNVGAEQIDRVLHFTFQEFNEVQYKPTDKMMDSMLYLDE